MVANGAAKAAVIAGTATTVPAVPMDTPRPPLMEGRSPIGTNSENTKEKDTNATEMTAGHPPGGFFSKGIRARTSFATGQFVSATTGLPSLKIPEYSRTATDLATPGWGNLARINPQAAATSRFDKDTELVEQDSGRVAAIELLDLAIPHAVDVEARITAAIAPSAL